MKLLAAAILVLCTTGCTAQQSPVVIATDIYVSCVTGYTQAYGIPRTKAGVEQHVAALDKACMEWTYAWLPGFLNKDRPTLTPAEDIRFHRHKSEIIGRYKEEILSFQNDYIRHNPISDQ